MSGNVALNTIWMKRSPTTPLESRMMPARVQLLCPEVHKRTLPNMSAMRFTACTDMINSNTHPAAHSLYVRMSNCCAILAGACLTAQDVSSAQNPLPLAREGFPVSTHPAARVRETRTQLPRIRGLHGRQRREGEQRGQELGARQRQRGVAGRQPGREALREAQALARAHQQPARARWRAALCISRQLAHLHALHPGKRAMHARSGLEIRSSIPGVLTTVQVIEADMIGISPSKDASGSLDRSKRGLVSKCFS